MQVSTRYEFKRSHILDQNISKDLLALNEWTNNPKDFLEKMNCVIFHVTPGEQEENRLLADTPAAQIYFSKLHEAWPFFFHFCFPLMFSYEWYLDLQYNVFLKQQSVPIIKDLSVIGLIYEQAQQKAKLKANELGIPDEVFELRRIPMYESFKKYLTQYSGFPHHY